VLFPQVFFTFSVKYWQHWLTIISFGHTHFFVDSTVLKGQCLEMDNFFEDLHTNLLCQRWWLLYGVLLCYLILQFLFTSMKLFTHCVNAYWNPPQVSHLCDWSMFSSLHPSLDNLEMHQNISVTGGFRYDFSWSQAAFCVHLYGQNSRCGVSQRVTERVFVISNRQDHWLRFYKKKRSIQNL
jgi:hypothetical protein